MSQATLDRKTFLQKLLDGVEVVGNKVPHPAVIFLLMSAIVMCCRLSFIYWERVSAIRSSTRRRTRP